MRPGMSIFAPTSSRFTWLIVLFSLAVAAHGAPSKVRIGTCAPLYPPFVMRSWSGFTGLEMALLRGAWNIMIKQTREINATADVMDLIGDTLPTIIPMAGYPDDAIGPLRNGTIDMYFCGAYMTPSRADYVDFSPPTIAAEFTMVVSAMRPSATLGEVQMKAFGKPNALAIYTVVILLFLNLLYAHLVWICERKHNGTIRTVYGLGIYDSFWMGIITATTIGFGDKTPRTYLGRIVTVIWMVIGMYFTGLFAAAITSGFITQALAEMDKHKVLDAPSELQTSGKVIGAAFPKAGDALLAEAPGTNVVNFDNPTAAYRALANGRIQVLIDDSAMASWNINSVGEFRGKFTTQGKTFGQVDYGFLFSMPGGKSHPIYTHFYRAMLEYLKGESRLSTDNIIRSWMGIQAPRTVETYPQVLKSWLAFINSQMGWVLFAWIITWVTVFAFSRPKRTQTDQMHLALVKVLKLEDFEFNRHIVRRAAEDLFDRIDVNRDETMEIDEVIDYLRKHAKYESQDFSRMFNKEVQQVIGQHPVPGGGGANQVARKGLGHRQTDNQNYISDVFGNMLSQAGSLLDRTNAALGKGSDSILNSLAAGKNTARPGADNHEVAMPSMASIGRTQSENERFAADQVTLTKEEFVQVITHIILECGNTLENTENTPATQHHLLHVHDEIRRQLDILDYKSEKVEARLVDFEEANRPSEPSTPRSGPAEVTYEERRAKMENRWKQTLGVDNLPASPMEMGVGVVFPNRFSNIARTDSAKPASHFSSAQPNIPAPSQNHQGFSPPVNASRPSAQTSPQGGGGSGRLNGVGASASGQMC